MTRISSHIRRGSMFLRKGRLRSDSWISSSASRGWRGKEAGCGLQDFMAQVRKLRVRSFILAGVRVALGVESRGLGGLECGAAGSEMFGEALTGLNLEGGSVWGTTLEGAFKPRNIVACNSPPGYRSQLIDFVVACERVCDGLTFGQNSANDVLIDTPPSHPPFTENEASYMTSDDLDIGWKSRPSHATHIYVRQGNVRAS